MSGSTARVAKAFAFDRPDRTPLFEIFQPYHPIHWPVCGRNLATDQAMAWDAMSDGVAWEELLDASIRAQFQIARFFGLDMVRLNGVPARNYRRPRKVGPNRWLLDGVPYHVNERTRLVELENPGDRQSDSRRTSEEGLRRAIEQWDGAIPAAGVSAPDPVLAGVRELAAAEGLDWVFMGEIGVGTGVAFFPPFMLMWLLEEPELVRRWQAMQMATGFPRTRDIIAQGCPVIAMGGDVSCDKGPFVSPAVYRDFVLPVIQEHVRLIHAGGARAVYTSDGNHWPIKDMFFFESGIDGYKEVDQAAGMTWPRLIEEGVAGRICIIGNLDARHTLCHATTAEVEAEVIACLRYGQRFPGGHILHASHSVHEDVKPENYIAAVNAYRRYFGLPLLEG
ncbi:MAG: Uroporphyrinogen decarboxylase (URO-D) [Lentisphaerae bacterium ADurb.BinA184]|nr:MAG: Uroporphyrinogen decarboxylase (URO-D) [Lentisphaerae bacterium ADurb.BinA184]